MCPKCSSPRNRSYGNQRKIDYTGKFAIYWKCLHCGHRYSTLACDRYATSFPDAVVAITRRALPIRALTIATEPDNCYPAPLLYITDKPWSEEHPCSQAIQLIEYGDSKVRLKNWKMLGTRTTPGYFPKSSIDLLPGGDPFIAALTWAFFNTRLPLAITDDPPSLPFQYYFTRPKHIRNGRLTNAPLYISDKSQ